MTSLQRRSERIKRIIEEGCGKLFPSSALVLGNTKNTYEFYHNADENSLFDIASLTKPIAGGIIALHLGLLEEKISSVLPKPKHDEDRKSEIKVSDILSHKAGFCSHIPLFEKHEVVEEKNRWRKREIAMHVAWDEKLCFSPGEKCEYSDVGFICLTFFIERKTKKRTKDIFREIREEIGLSSTLFFSEAEEEKKQGDIARRVIPTSYEFRVHDENSYIMCGESLHAGLLSTARDIAKFSLWLIKNLGEKFLKEGISYIMEGNRFFLGFDTFIKDMVIEDGSEILEFLGSGGKIPEDILLFGHLGFTGCGFWINFSREEFLVFLSNRVYPSHTGKYPEPAPMEFLRLRRKVWEEFLSE